jgi:uncharacterized damage-inducible protein DinB
MALTEKETLLAAFDDAWSHKWESFDSITAGLTEEEAQFQHPVYSDTVAEEGWPNNGSIIWNLVHMEYWYRYYIEVILRTPPAKENMPPVRSARSLADAMQNLLNTRSELRNAIASVSDDDLDQQKGTMRLGEFIRMVIRHDTYHTAQIAVLRRLYRMR